MTNLISLSIHRAFRFNRDLGVVAEKSVLIVEPHFNAQFGAIRTELRFRNGVSQKFPYSDMVSISIDTLCIKHTFKKNAPVYLMQGQRFGIDPRFWIETNLEGAPDLDSPTITGLSKSGCYEAYLHYEKPLGIAEDNDYVYYLFKEGLTDVPAENDAYDDYEDNYI